MYIYIFIYIYIHVYIYTYHLHLKTYNILPDMCLASSGETRVFHICMKSSFTKIQLYNCNVFNIEFEQLIKVSQGN